MSTKHLVEVSELDNYESLVNAALSAAYSKAVNHRSGGSALPAVAQVTLVYGPKAARGESKGRSTTTKLQAAQSVSAHVTVSTTEPTTYSRGQLWLCTEPTDPRTRTFLIATTTSPATPNWYPLTNAGLIFAPTRALLEADTSLRPPLSVSTASTFESVVARLQTTSDYVFGTSRTPSSTQTAIRDLNELALHFNAFEDNTGMTTINGEIQRYLPFNTTNHVFEADQLKLRAAMAAGTSWGTTVITKGSPSGYGLNNAATPIANLGLANTDGLEIGQLVVLQWKGIGYITAIVANTSVTLTQLNGGEPSGSEYNNLIAWTPARTATLAQPYTTGNQIVLSTLPTGIQQGMAVGLVINTAGNYQSCHRDNLYQITSIDVGTKTLTLDKPMTLGNLSSGARLTFVPAVTSGQIWSKETFDIRDPNTFFATELECEIMSTPSAASDTVITTQTAYAALPADVPWGAWPAFWMYSAEDLTNTLQSDTSEIDILEMYWNTSAGFTRMSSGNIGTGLSKNLFQKSKTPWSYYDGFHRKNDSQGLTGTHKIQMIFYRGRTYRFVDNVLIRIEQYEWTSQRPMQIGLNLSAGSWNGALVRNLLLPMQDANFQGMSLGIKRLRTWSA